MCSHVAKGTIEKNKYNPDSPILYIHEFERWTIPEYQEVVYNGLGQRKGLKGSSVDLYAVAVWAWGHDNSLLNLFFKKITSNWTEERFNEGSNPRQHQFNILKMLPRHV